MSKQKKVMVTGARGFLGRHLVPVLESAGYEVAALGHDEIEITDADSVEKAINAHNPDIIVNCAAISSTGYAAEHPDESMAINVEACAILAQACAVHGIKFYTMSSDQVYAACPAVGPIPENLPLSPGNTYGLHKYMMEGKVMAKCTDAVVLRLPWMFEAYQESKPHTDIVSRFVEAKRNGNAIKASTKEFRGMSDVDEICSNIVRSFDLLPGGVYNFGSENRQDSYSTYVKIAEQTGFPVCSIIADESWGRNISMDCSKLASFGIIFSDTVSSVCRKLS